MAKHPKRPRDPNQLAKLIVDMTVGEVPNDSPKGPDTPAIQARRKEAGVADHVWSLEEIAELTD